MQRLGQKRKRSDTAESSLTSAESDLGESPRKRSHELNTDPLGDLDDPVGNVEQSTEPAEDAVDTPTLDERRVTPVPPAKAVKGRKGKQKGRKPKEHIVEPEALPIEDPPEPEEEPSEENAAKTEEELKLKKEASSIFEDVAKQFRAFRERLYNERLAAMTEELQLLSAQDCVHPEYMRQVASVDARLKKQQSEAHAFYNYKMRCIRERTLGERAQLHSQYYQHVRELREDVLYKLGEDWYAIQKERRQSHQEKDDAYIYKFPAKKSVQIRNQAKYNQEVSVLSGVAKYVGFPAAPNINGVEGDSFEDDMKAMKVSFSSSPASNPLLFTTEADHPQISKRVHQPAAAPPRTVYLPTPSAASFAQNERLAHEQFIEQNPWARPQAPIHSHGTPGISHTPDWAEPNPTAGHSSAKHLIRNLSGIQRNANSPFATPVPQKRTLLELSSSQGTVPVNNSDGPEAPSSVLAAPPTTDRISLLQHGSSNLASPVMIAKHRQNGTELTGFRNFSNISGISGASTIDAPQEPEVDRERDVTKGTMPALMTIPSAPQQIFDTSQLHRHVDERREVYSNPGFRPQEGAFGTPAPLPATTAAP